MKYQKLDNQESHWKWLYLTRKAREGENITAYQEKSRAVAETERLIELLHQPEAINQWIANHLSLELIVKLDQAIRAKRKRFYNAEKKHTKKKSIDLDYKVWLRLSRYSKKMKMTLSETIMYMIDERETKARYADQVSIMRASLKELLEQEKK
ncbi:Ter macrodomain-binding protein MatP [Mergibacter septicus]|uniref:macrodomain Ter protein MatP n=1 Tax=Mergibacter septicus TaxID=221402 RepID=UPI001178E5D3|nr:macrodomain Ter protein MatP [Mergibacter septicus]AWX13368.1 Ter macrodomain-binding protein MatP [Mergibacter septicus]